MKLIVAEKPSAAAAIAEAMGANKRDGYYEVGEYQITYSFGHLVGLAMPEVYDESLKKWTKESLPILPEEFIIQVSEDAGIQKQFNTIKDLMYSADQVICATDSDREGDLIFHYIYKLAGCKTPYKRVLPSDLSKKGIEKMLSKEIDPRTDIIKAAECRNESDWLIGINATRAITISANQKISIGRVQTPTLALVCERFLVNKNFVSTPFFPVSIELEKDGIKFKAKIKENPKSEDEAKSLVSEMSDSSTCTFSERKNVEEKQPLPYFLSSLQIEASNKFNFTAQKTLDIAQSLYETHKITTYPRTDSGYLTSELYNETPGLLSKVLELYNEDAYKGVINLSELPKTAINDKKAPNHHGIIPTSDLGAYAKLSQDEKKLFDLIAKRFLAAFANKCVKDKTKYEFDNNGKLYSSNGTVIVENGWRSIYQDVSEDEENEGDEENSNLPDVSENDSLITADSKYETSHTKAPAILTEATLLQLMKSCGNKLEDEELKKAMKDSELRTGGLGTEATRAGIIQNLFTTSVVTKDGKKIIPTDMGLSLYEEIKTLDISKAELTATWEMKLDKVAIGEYDSSTFIAEIKEYTTTVTNEMLAVGLKVDTDNLKLKCPKCKEGKIIEGKKGYGCSRWNEEPKCDFVIWKNSYGKNISLDIATQLIEEGKTKSKLKGLKLPDKEDSFEAFLVVTEEFKVKAQSGTGEVYECPLCKGDVKINGGGAFCENGDVKIFRTVAKKKLSDKALEDLLKKGQTGTIKGFVSKKGSKFDAKLKLDEKGVAGFVFDKK